MDDRAAETCGSPTPLMSGLPTVVVLVAVLALNVCAVVFVPKGPQQAYVVCYKSIHVLLTLHQSAANEHRPHPRRLLCAVDDHISGTNASSRRSAIISRPCY
jgi:hypothetical protein